jgi:methanesulfonate monooxygenase large subunit
MTQIRKEGVAMENRLNAVSPEKVPNLPSSHFVDTRIYTDTRIFEEERVKIFGKVWNFVCLESEIANAGSFRTATVAGYPLVVVRQNDPKGEYFL